MPMWAPGRPSGRIRKPTKPKALKFHAARSPRHSMPQVVEFPHGLHEPYATQHRANELILVPGYRSGCGRYPAFMRTSCVDRLTVVSGRANLVQPIDMDGAHRS